MSLDKLNNCPRRLSILSLWKLNSQLKHKIQQKSRVKYQLMVLEKLNQLKKYLSMSKRMLMGLLSKILNNLFNKQKKIRSALRNNSLYLFNRYQWNLLNKLFRCKSLKCKLLVKFNSHKFHLRWFKTQNLLRMSQLWKLSNQ